MKFSFISHRFVAREHRIHDFRYGLYYPSVWDATKLPIVDFTSNLQTFLETLLSY